MTFDAPTREECAVNRTNSNTPLQALELLNDPIYVEAARVFAQNILRHGSSLNGRIVWAFERALDRAPTATELRIIEDLHRQSFARFRNYPADAADLIHAGEAPVPADLKPAELAAMTMVARSLLNLHETITRN